MRVAGKDHRGTILPFLFALQEAGHEISQDGPTDLFLTDLDPDLISGYRDVIDFYKENGAVVLLYPHGAGGPALHYDNLYEPYESVDGQLIVAPGEEKFLRLIDVNRPTRTVGWTFCKQLPFRPAKEVRKVVFAPWHANAEGVLFPPHQETNVQMFESLLEGPWQLTVRLVDPLEYSGLWRDDRVYRYIHGMMDMTTAEIDGADLVVSAGLSSYTMLSVARGAPTVVYHQLEPPNYALTGEEVRPLRRKKRYADLVRYPYDVADGPLEDVMSEAARGGQKLDDWKANWIGEPFEPSKAVRAMEDFVSDVRSLDSRVREAPVR